MNKKIYQNNLQVLKSVKHKIQINRIAQMIKRIMNNSIYGLTADIYMTDSCVYLGDNL